MLKRLLLSCLFVVPFVCSALAQQVVLPCAKVGQTSCAPVSASAPLPVTITGGSSSSTAVTAATRSAIVVQGCTVGTSSAQCLAVNTAASWIQVQNTSVNAQIACTWSGIAALNSNGSFMLQPNQSASWGLNSSGVPTAALNCVASAASTPLYLEYR